MNNTISDENITKKADPFWLRPSADRQCAAKSKQTDQRCKLYASPGKRVCRFHGGRSTGPKTPAVKHGETTLEMLKAKAVQRVKAAADTERQVLQHGFSEWLDDWIAAMDYKEFRRCRPALTAFVRGQLSAGKLVKIIEGKAVYHHDGRKSE